jgi:hypothetical protein
VIRTTYVDVNSETTKRVIRDFVHHPPGGDQVERYIQIRERGRQLAMCLCSYCPPSRELSLALTNIEQSVMWANAAIARNEKPTDIQGGPGVAIDR